MEIKKILVAENVGWLTTGDHYTEITYVRDSEMNEEWYRCWINGQLFRNVHGSYVVLVDYV